MWNQQHIYALAQAINKAIHTPQLSLPASVVVVITLAEAEASGNEPTTLG